MDMDRSVDELVEAARAHDSGRIKEILASGIDIDCTNSYGWTALMRVAHILDIPAVKLLLAEGASPHISKSSHHTARSLAEGSIMREFVSDEECNRMSKEVVQLLDSAREMTSASQNSQPASGVKYGEFNEPYCSEECYRMAGEEILARSFKGNQGVCAFCQTPVDPGFREVRQNIFFPFRGQLLFICTSCIPRGKVYVGNISECCMCGKLLTAGSRNLTKEQWKAQFRQDRINAGQTEGQKLKPVEQNPISSKKWWKFWT
jgi:hypothetical protein